MKTKEYKEPKRLIAHYNRWLTLNQRCNNFNHKSFARYGGRGIIVETVWEIKNPKALDNFSDWVKQELKKHPELKEKKFIVGRKSIDDNFGPSNCFLTTNDLACQQRNTAKLTFNKVVEIRQFKKAWPEATLIDMSIAFKQSVSTLSYCLRGKTWANVDATEAPIPTR